MRRNFKIDRFALDDFNRLSTKEARYKKLFDFGRCGHNGGKSRRGIGADGHGDLEPRAFQITERHLGQATNRGAGNCDCSAGRLCHRGDTCALRAVLALV